MKTKKFAAAVLTMALAAMTSMPAFAGKFVFDREAFQKDYSEKYRYINDDGTYLSNGWYWLDRDGDGTSECYYFDQDGLTLSNKKTPDGYQVNTIGAWIENGILMEQGVATVDLSKAASLVGTYTTDSGYVMTVTDNGDGKIRVTDSYGTSLYYYDGKNYRGYLWVLDSQEEKGSFYRAGVGQLDDGDLVRISQ